MYTFLAGPALWATFIIFFGGLIFRILYLYRLSRKKDRVVYNHASFNWGLKSILYIIGGLVTGIFVAKSRSKKGKMGFRN